MGTVFLSSSFLFVFLDALFPPPLNELHSPGQRERNPLVLRRSLPLRLRLQTLGNG